MIGKLKYINTCYHDKRCQCQHRIFQGYRPYFFLIHRFASLPTVVRAFALRQIVFQNRAICAPFLYSSIFFRIWLSSFYRSAMIKCIKKLCTPAEFFDYAQSMVARNSSPLLGLSSAGAISKTVLQPCSPFCARRKAARA